MICYTIFREVGIGHWRPLQNVREIKTTSFLAYIEVPPFIFKVILKKKGVVCITVL